MADLRIVTRDGEIVHQCGDRPCGGEFGCERCGRSVGWCFGGDDDDDEELCDDCWSDCWNDCCNARRALLLEIDRELQRPARLAELAALECDRCGARVSWQWGGVGPCCVEPTDRAGRWTSSAELAARAVVENRTRPHTAAAEIDLSAGIGSLADLDRVFSRCCERVAEERPITPEAVRWLAGLRSDLLDLARELDRG